MAEVRRSSGVSLGLGLLVAGAVALAITLIVKGSNNLCSALTIADESEGYWHQMFSAGFCV
jgi:hypothetical protein